MRTKRYILLFTSAFIMAANALYAGSADVYGYIENRGQIRDQFGNARPDVAYMYVDETFKVVLRNTGFSYEWVQANYISFDPNESGYKEVSDDPDETQDYPAQFTTNRIDVDFLDANRNILVTAAGESPFYRNYFNQHTGPEGITRVRNYQTVTYHNVYDGIDLVFSTVKHTDGRYYPEYRFVVRPQGNMNQIALAYHGIDQMSLDGSGALQLQVPLGKAQETRPVILFEDGTPQQQGSFLQQGNVLRFNKVKHEPGQTFIIDPTIVWSTYWGGTLKDQTDEIEVDSEGNCYVTGRVRSTNFFATSGAYQTTNAGGIDVPLMKWDPDGNLIYATYYGGEKNEIGFNVVVDAYDQVWIGGHTFSTSGIATVDAVQDTFSPGDETDDYDLVLAKFSSDGDLLYGTYMGGPGQDEIQGLWADTDGSIYLSGFSESFTGIIFGTPCFDCTGDTSGAVIVMRLNNDGSQVWANYWAGHKRDRGHGITTYGNNVYQIASCLSTEGVPYGSPSGADFKTYNSGLNDIMFARWNKTTGEPIWVGYFGGVGDERARDIRCDRDGYIYFIGQTESGGDSLATPGALKESFVYTSSNRDGILAKFDSNFNKIKATYYGGNNIEFPRSMRITPEGAPVYIGGYTKSDSFFATSNAYDKKLGKPNDAFWLKINHDFSVLQYATYFGGKKQESTTEPGWYGPTMTLDKDNNVFLSSGTNSADGIAVNAYKDSLAKADQYDFFLAKFADPCPDGFEPNGEFSKATQLRFRNGSEIVWNAPIQEKNDKDYYTFTTSGSNTNIKVELMGQPLDYNLFVYNNANSEIGKSKNGSTADESVTVNNTYVGDYKVLVKSNGTDFAEGVCYTLKVTMSETPLRSTDETATSVLGSMSLYPNPAGTVTELIFEVPVAGEYSVEITSLDGKLIRSEKVTADAGKQSMNLPLDGMNSGNYLVRLSGNGVNDFAKLVVKK